MNRDDAGPAFPFVYDDTKNYEEGMSLRDYFAAHAPNEIPNWFHGERDPAPDVPDVKVPDEFANEFSDWRRGPVFDLTDSMQLKYGKEAADIAEVYESAWQDFWEKYDSWKHVAKLQRYFQWRWHYADMMISTREVK